MIGHHSCHGGYDKGSVKSPRFNRSFALGTLLKRAIDWFDWMLPEAWNHEHNNLHHYNLGEVTDPDLVENNLQAVRESSTPLVWKYMKISFVMATWKWSYYAPNTWKALKIHQLRSQGEAIQDSDPRVTTPYLLNSLWSTDPVFRGDWVDSKSLLGQVLLPYFIFRFLITPLPLLFLFGNDTYFNAIVNLILAEILTNLHAFVVIAPNHAGSDLYRFNTHVAPKSATFYLRQVISSVDFNCGGDVNDFLHGYLNYQIEHHCFPDLTMRSYQKAHPLLKEICRKHKVPWVQENAFIRTKKLLDIMTGRDSMKIFPREWERGL
jgi:fatty acid desaturase